MPVQSKVRASLWVWINSRRRALTVGRAVSELATFLTRIEAAASTINLQARIRLGAEGQAESPLPPSGV